MPSPNLSILDLPLETIGNIMAFVGPGHYRYVALTCQGLHAAYTRQYPNNVTTSRESIVGSIGTAGLYVLESKWLKDQWKTTRKPSRLYFKVALSAARYGRLDLLKWMGSRYGFIYECRRYQLLDRAAQGGHIDCFQYLTVNTERDIERYLPCAARNGQLAFLHHFHDKGCPFNEMICNAAAESGQLEVLQFLHEVVKCPCSEEEVCKYAARGGHLKCLVYLISTKGVRIFPSLLKDAISSEGNVECLRYIFENYIGDWDMAILKKSLKAAAGCYGKIDCLCFLLQVDSIDWEESDLESALVASAKYGQFDCFRYLMELDHHEWSGPVLDRALSLAAGTPHCSYREENGALACLDYLLNEDHHQHTWSNLAIHNALEKAEYSGPQECLDRLLQVEGVDWDRDLLSSLEERGLLRSEWDDFF